MPVGIGNYANPVTLLKSVVNQPFESSPGRVNLDGLFETLVVGNFNIGVASTDMREHGTVFVFERAKQIAGRGGVGFDIRQIIDQRVR